MIELTVEAAPVLADAALKASALLLLALGADFLLRRSSAAARHLMWSVAVVAVLVIPLASAGLPRVPAGFWPDLTSPEDPAETSARTEEAVERLREGPALIREREAADGGPGAAGGPALSGDGSPGYAGPADRPAPVEGLLRGQDDGHAAAAGSSSTAAADGSGWTTVAVMAWAIGVVLVLLLLTVERALLFVRARRGGAFGRGRVRGRARNVGRRLGLRRMPRLMRLETGAMPATWGVFRHTVALPAEAEGWPDERLESVLAHELAHVRRRDCAIQTMAVVVCAFHWFNPLAWLAAARLRRERELAADDEVLARGARASSYARELLSLARSAAHEGPVLTATAMAAGDGLPTRIRSVVSDGRPRRVMTGSLVVRTAAGGAMLLLPLAALSPARAPDAGGSPVGTDGTEAELIFHEADRGSVAGPEECWRPDVSHSMSVHASDDRHALTWRSDGCEATIVAVGRIRFTEDFTGVRSLATGGMLRVEEQTDGYRRSVEYRAEPGADVVRTFRRDGREAEPTPDEERWIRERLVTVLRQTGIAAGERVAWILDRSGPDGVLDELEWIVADGVMGRYMEELLARAGLDASQLRRFLTLGAERMGSDGALSEVLIRTVGEYPGPVSGAARREFRGAAGTVGSDGSLGRVVEAMVERPEADDALVALALEVAARGIGSDGQMSRFLRVALDRQTARMLGGLREEFRAAAETVGSDGSLGSVVRAMAGPESSGELVGLALEVAAADIGSDGEMAGFLRDAVRHHPDLVAGPHRAAFLSAASTVGSDGSLGSLLEEMVNRDDASTDLVSLALQASVSIGSDGQMARLLVRAASRHPELVRAGAPLSSSFQRALSTVGSDGEELRVRRALERASSAR